MYVRADIALSAPVPFRGASTWAHTFIIPVSLRLLPAPGAAS